MKSFLDQVTHELLWPDNEKAISRQSVQQWAQSDDLEVMGAVFKLLHKPEQYSRITPPLNFDDYRSFHLKYYERCIQENPDGTWTESRYLAAHSLVAWFIGLWDNADVPRQALADLKELLARMYVNGEEKIRTCVVTGALEHLFERRDIVNFFNDWKDIPELATAYAEANVYRSQ